MITARFRALRDGARAPEYKSRQAAGADLCACLDTDALTIAPGKIRVIPTGIAVEIPEGFGGQVRPRSGMASRGIVVILGTIDADYRGEIGVILHNCSRDSYKITSGDRVAQLVISPVMRVDYREALDLSLTMRGKSGFGSTGT